MRIRTRLVEALVEVDLGGREGKCFILSYQALKGKDDDARLVHGEVTHPVDGRKFPHGWMEDGGTVFDPVLDVKFPVSRYYSIYKIHDVEKYSPEEAMLLLARTGNYGPWTPSEVHEVRERIKARLLKMQAKKKGR